MHKLMVAFSFQYLRTKILNFKNMELNKYLEIGEINSKYNEKINIVKDDKNNCQGFPFLYIFKNLVLTQK